MILTIRRAQAEDTSVAWEIRNAAILSGCRGFYPDALLEVWTSGGVTEKFVQFFDGNFYVAYAEDKVIGTGMIDPVTGKLDAIFVRPDMMGHGVGKQIMQFLEDVARTNGLKTLTLEATLNAGPFYRRCGFVGDVLAVHKSSRGIELDCIPMTKTLLP